MSDSPAKAGRKATACDKNATVIEFPAGEKLTEQHFRKLNNESWIDRGDGAGLVIRRS